MFFKPDAMLQNSPEFCKALKLVIKFQISTLLQQLAESGEESIVITANIGEGTADHLGSDKGSSFLEARDELQRQFLSFCTDPTPHSADVVCRKQRISSNYGDDTFAGHLLSPSQISCSPLLSPSSYHKAAAVRTRYERESSTSDSVFSPHRRKSSASSRSLEEENLFTSSEYQETKKSVSESDTCFREWPSQPSNLSVDPGEKALKYLQVKSPSCEDNNSLRVLTLSSPSEFQYRKQTKSVSRLSLSSADLTSVSSSEKVSPSPGRISNSSSSSENQDSINTVQGQKTNTCQRSPVDFYKTPGCGLAAFPTPHPPHPPTPTTPTISINEAAGGVSGADIYKMPYEPSELKSPYMTSEPKFRYSSYETEQTLVSPYTSVDMKERKIKSMSDYEIYDNPKVLESKAFREGHHYGTQSQETVERKHFDTETVPVFKMEGNANDVVQVKDTDNADRPQEMDTGSVKDKTSLNQEYRGYSFGLLSPLQRSFLYGGRALGRERSQSLSEVVNLTREDLGTVTHRARFPSSSFVENLDTPLIIDDDVKVESESYEGLDLSKKRRKLSETYQSGEDQVEVNPASDTTNTDDKDIQEKASYQSASGVDSSVKKYGKGNFIKVATGYQCRICCRVIRHMNNTTAHMRIHANLKPYKCQVCNQQFKYEVDRRYHFSKQHVDLFAKMYFPDGEKKAE